MLAKFISIVRIKSRTKWTNQCNIVGSREGESNISNFSQGATQDVLKSYSLNMVTKNLKEVRHPKDLLKLSSFIEKYLSSVPLSLLSFIILSSSSIRSTRVFAACLKFGTCC
jgi:hypothetical protein